MTGGGLVVDGCSVTGMPTGIAFQPAATATLWVSNSHFLGIGSGRGIEVRAGAGTAYANIARAHAERYASGIYGGDRSKIEVSDTVATRDEDNYELEATVDGIPAEMNITRSVSSYSVNAGIRTSGSSLAVARISDSVIVDENNNAVAASTGRRS